MGEGLGFEEIQSNNHARPRPVNSIVAPRNGPFRAGSLEQLVPPGNLRFRAAAASMLHVTARQRTMQRTACASFSISTLRERRLRANGVHTLKWMDGQRAEHHGGNHGEGAVKRGGVQSPPG